MISPTALETCSLILRALCLEDLEPLKELLSRPDTRRDMGLGPSMEEKVDVASFLSGVLHSHKTGGPIRAYAMIRKSDKCFVGAGGLLAEKDRLSAEFFCAVLPPYRGRGYASETAKELAEEACRRESGTEVIAYVRPSNQASIRCLEKAGFQITDLIDHPSYAEKMLLLIRRMGK